MYLLSFLFSSVCGQVGHRHRIGKRKLGMPMEKEARDMLVQTKGSVEEACRNIAKSREKKVCVCVCVCGVCVFVCCVCVCHK